MPKKAFTKFDKVQGDANKADKAFKENKVSYEQNSKRALGLDPIAAGQAYVDAFQNADLANERNKTKQKADAMDKPLTSKTTFSTKLNAQVVPGDWKTISGGKKGVYRIE